MLVLAGCSRPLPEAGTASAVLYEARCGSCHRAVNPASMKYALWEMVLPRMEQRMHEAHLPPLSEDESASIRDYLKRNSS
jgi:Dihaem cytochrome c